MYIIPFKAGRDEDETILSLTAETRIGANLGGSKFGKPKAPTPPDPKDTAAAQTGTNVATAVANTQLGQVNQVGPDSTLTYSQTGSNSFTGPTSGDVKD